MGFIDHPAKKIIREQWCEPLLKFVHNYLNYKLIYLGLPGPQAIDLLSWIDYIEQVIAFQCREYPKPSSKSQPKTMVQRLEEKLRELERQGKIKNFSVYDGYIEEVILRGTDINGNRFSQQDVVTIYNLDFCNGITVPLLVIDKKGVPQNLYKSETIRKLLEIQRDIPPSTGCKKFVMFLTIHSGFWLKEEKRFISQNQDEDIKKYICTLNKLRGWQKRIRLVKAYTYQIIKDFFCHCGFTPEFLPIINYEGSGNNWLMHFTIVGSFNRQVSGLSPYFQNSQEFLMQKFLTIEDNKLFQTESRGVKEIDVPQDLVKAFKSSQCYKQLWTKKR